MKNRRDFLKDVCPTVAFAFFGVSFLEACSSGDEDVDVSTPDPGNGNGNGGGSTSQGFTKNGNVYTIDLTNSNFSDIASVGGWMNGKSLGIPALFLRISETTVNAYTNVCPFHSRDNEWVLENANTFRCNHQQNSFSTDCDDSTSLSCYDTTPVNGNEFTATIS